MKKNALLVVLLVAAVPAHSQDFWQKTAFPSRTGWSRTLAITSAGHIIAYGDSGTYRSTDEGESWTPILPESDSTNVTVLAVSPTGTLFAGTFKGGSHVGRLFRSTSNGATWTNTGLPNLGYYALAITRNDDVLAGSEYAGVFRSSDDGASWDTVWHTSSMVWALAIDSNGHVLAGTGYDGAFHAEDPAGSWSQVNTGLPWTHPAVFDFAINAGGDVFAAVDSVDISEVPVMGGVFRSTDHGATWVERSGGLTDNRVTSLTVNASGDLFAGTWGSGVFRSTDGGGSWTQQDLNGCYVFSLATGPSGFIYAATDSGLFRSALPTAGTEEGIVEPRTFRLEQNYPNPFNPFTTIRYSIPVGGYVRLSIYNVLGQEVAALVSRWEDPGYHILSFDAGDLPSGVYTYRIASGAFTDVMKMLLIK